MTRLFASKDAVSESQGRTRTGARSSSMPNDHALAALHDAIGNRGAARTLARITPAATMPAVQRRASLGMSRDASLGQGTSVDQRALHDLGPGRPMEQAIRAPMEAGLGVGLSDVRVHMDAGAARAARHLRAEAFAVGQDIYFGSDRYRPDTQGGRHLLAHELTHTVQQRASGSVGPQASLPVASADDRLECEADTIAHRVTESAPPAPLAPGNASRSIQRQPDSGATPSGPSPAPAGPTSPGQVPAGQVPPGQGPAGQAPTAAPGTPVSTPIYWGLDTNSQPRRYYISIPPPGGDLSEVATFIYGSPAQAADLRAANPGVGGSLAPGTTLVLAAGTLSSAAQQSLNQALTTGLLLRTEGIPVSSTPPPDAVIHHLTIGAQVYDLLDAQYAALLRGLAWHLGIKADQYKGLCEVYLETRNDHVENNSSIIRGISDWAGDVSVPDESVYTGPRNSAQALIDDLAKGEPTEASIIDASRRLRAVMSDYYAGEDAWNTYITGTIQGAGGVATGLEAVRNTCFAIEAGLAGAVVAPAAFALAGGGALGVTAAVGGGAIAGGTLRGTLEVALPGLQADRPADERFTSGFKSGAIQGGIGAAGALAAPGVSGALAPKLGIAADAVPTVTQRLVLGGATGAVIGAPSGAAAAALTNAGPWIDGEMSLPEYLGSIRKGTAGGLIGGGVFGMLPIEGLYRSGGEPLNPFSGEPFMPRWMMAGPYSPLQPAWNPPPEFNALPATALPRFPEPGYGWARINGVWEPIALTGPNQLPLTLRAYGPDANGRTNYNILAGDRLMQSATVTRPTGNTYAPGNRGQMPYNAADFTEPTGQAWIVGHNADYADTTDTPGAANSNIDPLNYTPEPNRWGLVVRRLLVAAIRRANGGYRQMNYYGPNPRTTASGNPIPDGVYFVQTTRAGVATRAWNIPFDGTGPTQFSDLPNFEVPLNQVPAGLLSPTPAPSISGAGGAAGGQAAWGPTPGP